MVDYILIDFNKEILVWPLPNGKYVVDISYEKDFLRIMSEIKKIM